MTVPIAAMHWSTRSIKGPIRSSQRRSPPAQMRYAGEAFPLPGPRHTYIHRGVRVTVDSAR